ncbi:beta strand repeat-containing protein, partial [Parasphingorhabdus sp.]|uniref:beta strand repeat-containing protein n=1 Tax=Parasphingorhabdus sp. TaxID=2709688 RepID=UPI003003432B
ADAFDAVSGSLTFSNSNPSSGFYVTGDSGAVSVLGDLTVNVVGNIEYDFDGDAQMTVGGNATLNSGQGILINHTNNLNPVNSIDVSGTFAATALGNFVSTEGSRINAADTATVRAEQNATVADIAGVDLVSISALFDANVTNAAVTGIPVVFTSGAPQVGGPELTITAGFDPFLTSGAYDPNYNANVSGLVTSTGFIRVRAGGTATFLGGSSTISDNGLTVQTGDDIIIESGASVTAANNPATTPSAATPFTNLNNLRLQAGGITDIFTTPPTPIASIVAAGDINANNFAVVMTANAVDGLGGTITASSISVDVNNAPANGVTQSDDNGLLSAQCLEGNVCLGTLNADNLVYIGQASNNDVIQAIVESGTVSANDILVTNRRDIVMGTTGIATTLDAVNQLALQSTEGDIDLTDVSVTSNSITIDAAGSLLGTADLDSASDIGITVGADINAASITTGGQLTTVAQVGAPLEASFTVPGSIIVGTLSQSADIDIDISAGGDVSFDQIDLPANRSITLTAATGDAFLGSNSSATSISVLGNNVGFNDLLSSGGITLDATNGDLTGTGPGDLTAGGSINLQAANTIDIGNATNTGLGQGINLSANDVTASALTTNSGDILVSAAQDIALGSAATSAGTPTAGSIGLLAGNDIVSNGTLDAGEDVAIRALGDVSLTTVSAGDDVAIDADGAISLASATASGTGIDLFALSFDTANAGQAGSIAFASETLTGSNIQLDSGSDITATGALDAVDDINVTATGTPTVANAISGGDTNITGASVALNNGTIGGNLTLNALAGNIDSNGTVVVGNAIDLDATGDAGFADLLTQTGAITITAGGSINGGDLDAASDIGLDGGNIAVGDAAGDAITMTSGSDILFDALTSTGSTTLTASNGTIGANTGAGDITATGLGQSINLSANDVTASALTTNSGDILVSAAQDIALGSAATSAGTPTAGSIGLLAGNDIVSNGTLDAGEDVAIRALGDVSLTTVSAGDDVAIDADGAISLASATASGTGIDLFALSFDTANAGQAGSIAFASETLTGSNIQLDSGSDITATGALDAVDDINVTATGTPTVANAISGGDTNITGASVALNNGTIGGNLTLNALAGNIDGNGTVTVGGDIDLDATGDVGFGDLDAQGGTFTVDAGGNINFASAASSSGTTLNAGGDIAGDDLTSDGDIAINGGGDADLGTVDSGANVRAQLQGAFAANEVNAATTSQGENEVDISAENGIEIANVSGNNIFLTAAAGLVNVTNNVDVSNSIVASGEAVSIVTQQQMRVRAEATNGDINLSSAAGLEVDGAQATGDITLSADDNVSINGLVSASNGLQITAGRAIDIQADAIGGTIQTVSADMNIGSAGSLGQNASTSDIRISTDGTRQMRLGDETDLGGTFSLTNDEFSRIHSGGDLTINVAETGLSGFDLTIQTLTASAFSDGNFGSDGNFNIFADQSITVIGDLSVQGDSNTNLNLAVGDDLFVNAATGSITMANDASLSGNLSLTARNIYAMSDQAFTDIQGMSTAEIDARLAENDGNVRDNGFIRADAISVTLLASQFYVQNTGSGTAFDARRGFVAGAGGLSINAGPSGITPIVINGTVNGAAGIPAIPATTITGSGFNAASTINGCVINNPASCAPVTPTPTPTPTPGQDTPTPDNPVQDVIEEEVTPEEYEADPFATNLIEIKKNDDVADDPLINEPVTGAGNDDLWVSGLDCELDNDGKCLVDDDEDEEELQPAE